jgi:uncharacterized protein YjgD (DUF1641 family)
MGAITEASLQDQINDLNSKLDFIVEEISIQKQKRLEVEDLIDDMSIIGKDLFKATVDELDHAGVEVDTEALKSLVFRLIRNVGTLNELVEMVESLTDLMKDVAPILHQVGLDSIKKMQMIEEKGYFEFAEAFLRIMDNIVTHFTAEDVKQLADNVVTILETVKNLTQPEMLDAMNNAVNIYKKIETRNLQEYSLWKAFKEMKTPEMRRGIGFMITFLKNIADEGRAQEGDKTKMIVNN